MEYLEYDVEESRRSLEKLQKDKVRRRRNRILYLVLFPLILIFTYGGGGYLLGYDWGLTLVGVFMGGLAIWLNIIQANKEARHFKFFIGTTEYLIKTYPSAKTELEGFLKKHKFVGVPQVVMSEAGLMVKLEDTYQLVLDEHDILGDERGLFFSVYQIKDSQRVLLITHTDGEFRIFIPA
jgi:hypothetical protein